MFLIIKINEILKRLDDPTDKVRYCVLKSMPALFENCPEEFKNNHYKAHHELIIDTLLTHFDDDEEDVQEYVYGIFQSLAEISKSELLNKIQKHRPLLRNQKGCEEIMKFLEIDNQVE